ncbi:Ig-like domain-containing protein [Maribacter antarcticus]|uniref:Ig-like domain-containing protein n=1 Tax=Maribacter antarcticus TaxID=505250 RepID=UPI00068802B4|nr:Ig-like domain-containing protein [Maribacter antarcticus]
MKYSYSFFLITFLLGTSLFYSQATPFSQSQLDMNGIGTLNGVTGLDFGPDSRLYVAEYTGGIKIFTIQRNGPTAYVVTGMESLDGILTLEDHNDDGTSWDGQGTSFATNARETIGIVTSGTIANPIFYVSSSDIRIGAGNNGGNGDVGLDTNSGIITRFSWNGTAWDVVDLVRGLPRSEENHATNGLDLAIINGTEYLIVAQGGNTNGGSPSTNFVFANEYALSGAVLAIDLDALETLPILTDNGRQYVYDLATVDDPTRDNVNDITDPDTPGYDGVDVNDPWGGNDGLNMAILDTSSPVKMLSPGYRNAYDLVVTESGALYVTDNGANGGWGGFPVNEGLGGNTTNDYNPSEPGSSSPSFGEEINNKDHLELVTTDLQNYIFNSKYGGHPNPIRSNPFGAGLYTDNTSDLGTFGAPFFRTQTYDPDGTTTGSTMDPNVALPANWPPIQVANPVEGDWRGPGINNPDGDDDTPVLIWGTNTNGIDEYTASNFGGVLKGNLLAGHNGGNIRRVILSADGSSGTLEPNFFSGLGSDALGITCNSDDEIFNGSVWIGLFGGGIVVFEPQDEVECTEPGEPGYDPLADYDSDGYTNQDEEDNGTDACNGGSQPADFDKAVGAPLISDLNDSDDDADGIDDGQDSFQLGNPLLGGSDAFSIPISNDLFNSQQGLGGIFGLGMTGLMNNGNTNENWLSWLDRINDVNDPNDNDVLGGATGTMTSHMTSGTALGTENNQEKGYQYGVQVESATGAFTVVGGMKGFSGPYRLYGNTAAVGGELGLFIGDGTQSNYIKFVVTVDGFTVLQEINDIPLPPINSVLANADRPIESIRLYFVVEPVSGEVNMEYSVDNGARILVASVTAQGQVLDAIQQPAIDLAIGFIGTSGTAGVELEGSWDFLNVLGNTPVSIAQLPDLVRFVNTMDEDLNLDNNFTDDAGVQNLTYSVESNTNTNIGAAIIGNTLTLSYPATVENTSITIRATDVENNFTEQTFLVSVTDSPIVLYRINTGGLEIAAIDGEINWSEDSVSNNSPFLTLPGTNKSFASSITSLTPQVNTATTPLGIFDSERFDDSVGNPNMTYSFPVPINGNYEVRLYMGNSFSGTSAPNQRIFDVTLENKIYPELKNTDLSATYGHQTGTVITYVVPVIDGNLDVSFIHGIIENPLVNAIEILDVSNIDTPIYAYTVPDQMSNAGQPLNGSLAVQALGGDGNLTYAATGLPTGVFIEPTNGVIGGTIDAAAAAGSPYSVVVTIDDTDGVTTDQLQLSFQWDVLEPFAYRINVGGNRIDDTDDIGPSWENNAISGPQNEGVYAVNTGIVDGFETITFENKDSSIPAYINEAIFSELFGSERYDLLSQPEMIYTLPVENGDYVVNLYFGNGFNGAAAVGNRIFDILIEGNLAENNFDVISQFGHQIAGMLSYPVVVADGNLEISFEHNTQNPFLNAIEVFKVNTSNPVLALATINDVSNDTFDTVSIATNAVGGDPNEASNYYISGQPEGVVIDVLTGQISGSIAAIASIGGPNEDGVHSVTVTAVKPGSASSSEFFTWTVLGDGLFWTDIDENENYTPRHENSFVQAGDKFYLMGGRESATTIDVYDYASDSWNSLVDSAPFEFNHFQATEYQGLIWVIGAFNTNDFPNETPAENVWMFDPVRESWIQGPQIPAGRQRGGAGLVLHNDKFYILGGNTLGHSGGYVNWFDEYDPATGIWTELSDAPNARDHFGALVSDNKLYSAGGRLSGGPGGIFAPTVPEVDVYDFGTQSWITLPTDQNLPTPRGGTAVANYGNRLLIIGGEVDNQEVYGTLTTGALNIVEAYNPAAQVWERLPNLNYERHGTQAVVSGGGIFILSGSPNLGDGNQKNMEFYGENTPAGATSVASGLSAPELVQVEPGIEETFTITVGGGTVGEYIDSFVLSGSTEFSIVSGELNNAVVGPNTTYDITVTLDPAGAGETAILTINYGSSESSEVILTNDENQNGLISPDDQFNEEGDVISLPIIKTDEQPSDIYSATGLPPTLTIDDATGLITGTIDAGTEGETVYEEQNGLVLIEVENLEINPNWSIESSESGFSGTGYLFNTVDSFNTPGNGTITTKIEISTPGVYRFQWRNKIGIIAPQFPTTEHNDAWLRFPDADDFFGQKPGSTIYPIGSGQTPNPNGEGGGGWFKIYMNTIDWNWNAKTSDEDAHDIFVQFDTAGVYTMEISSRSDGHIIDKAALHLVTDNYTIEELDAAPESMISNTGIGGAEAGSPYNVEVTVTNSNGVNPPESILFDWIVGEDTRILVTGVTVDPTTDTIILGGTTQLTATVSPANADDISVVWSSSDEMVATVDAIGLVTSIGLGTAIITVTTNNGGFEADAEITIVAEPIPVTGVTVNPTTDTIVLGGTTQLTATVSPAGADDTSVTWSSSDEIIATVDANGLVTSIGLGTATITVTTTDGGFMADAAITIVAEPIPVTGVTVNPTTDTIVLGGTTQLTATVSPAGADDTSVTWSSSDVAIATVDGNGLVTSVGLGTATITVTTTDGGFMADAAITIVAEPILVTGVTVNPTTDTIVLGGTTQLTATVSPAGADDISVTWSSSDVAIATVDGNGLVTSVGLGTATITVTTTDGGFMADAAITIVAEPILVTGVTVNPTTDTIVLGGTAQLTATVSPMGAEDSSVTWSSSDETIATVDANGVVTSTSLGTATITVATIDGGFTANAEITVAADAVLVTGVTVNPTTDTIVLSGTTQLTATVSPMGAEDSSVTWSSSDETIVTVDANGVVTSVGIGAATITVTTNNGGFTADATLEVVAIANEAPTAVAQVSVLNGSAPLLVEFTGENSSDDKGIVSYLWDFGTGDTSTSPNPAYTFEFAGSFVVRLIIRDEEGLEDTATLTIEVIDNVTYNASQDNMFISPNPAIGNTEVIINLENPMPLLGIYIFDSTGKLVKQNDYFDSNAVNGSYPINVGNLGNGVYTVYTFFMGDIKPKTKKMIVRN